MTRAPQSLSAATRRAHRGFTLLEMMLVMFIVSLLVGAIFGIVDSVTQLTNELTLAQQREARAHAFTELCARTFRNLPPSAVVRLRNQQAGGRLASQLTLAGAVSPISGDAGGVIAIETQEAPDGYMHVALRSMTPDQASAWEKGDDKAGLRVPLLENVASLEWKFFDLRSGEWASVWNEKVLLFSPALAPPGPPEDSGLLPPSNPSAVRPSIVEMRLAFGAEPEQRFVFWAPPSQPINTNLNSPNSPNPPGPQAPSPQQPTPP